MLNYTPAKILPKRPIVTFCRQSNDRLDDASQHHAGKQVRQSTIQFPSSEQQFVSRLATVPSFLLCVLHPRYPPVANPPLSVNQGNTYANGPQDSPQAVGSCWRQARGLCRFLSKTTAGPLWTLASSEAARPSCTARSRSRGLRRSGESCQRSSQRRCRAAGGFRDGRTA